MELVLSQSKQPFSPPNCTLKEVTITPIKSDEADVVSVLKKLPDISYTLVKTKPIFKIPEVTQFGKHISKKISTLNKSENNIHKKKVLSERQNNIIINKKQTLTNVSERSKKFQKNSNNTPRPKQKQLNKVIPLKISNSSSITQKKTTGISKIYSPSEKENMPSTSTPKLVSPKTSNNTKVSTQTKRSIMYGASNEVKETSENDLTNNKEEKNIITQKSAEENYTLMDLSTDDHTIISASPYNFTSAIVPEYDNFVMGISQAPLNSTMHLEATQSYLEKETLNGQSLIGFSDFLGNCNNQINKNRSNESHINYAPLMCPVVTENSPTKNIKNEQIVSENEIN